MKRLAAFCCVGVMFFGCGLSAVAQETARGEAGGGAAAPNRFRVDPTGVELLSDTQGVDFKPYLKSMMKNVYRAVGAVDAARGASFATDEGRDADTVHDPSGWDDRGHARGRVGS